MIAEFLDRDYVIAEIKAQRDWLAGLRTAVIAKDPAALAALKREKITPAQIERVIAALTDALAKAKKDRKHPQGSAFIPSDPVACGLQQGLTSLAIRHDLVESNAPPPATRIRMQGAPGKDTNTSPPLRLRPKTRAMAVTRGGLRGGKFIEGSDPLYALDGFKAKFGALFAKRRKFNPKPAAVASTSKPLSLFLFGDWGTGLPLAAEVTGNIRRQLEGLGSSRQAHVVHLGDVYYAGDADEYQTRMLPFWPVPKGKRNSIGSWSLNGNHDMYSGGHGYFDTLLRHDTLARWHRDANGQPSSFFLIENTDWQIFGLDTSWKLPSLSGAIFGQPTIMDYAGQNGILTKEQVKWMASARDPGKGCILLTHHQPASSRTGDKQHADQAIGLMENAGVYSQIDAWIWGHEHRCVVFKPKSQRRNRKLREAPAFCACLGTGGVPVTRENFADEKRISDVLWEEDRFGTDAPLYEGIRVLPFGFGRIDTRPGAFDFTVFDHTGAQRYQCAVNR